MRRRPYGPGRGSSTNSTDPDRLGLTCSRRQHCPVSRGDHPRRVDRWSCAHGTSPARCARADARRGRGPRDTHAPVGRTVHDRRRVRRCRPSRAGRGHRSVDRRRSCDLAQCAVSTASRSAGSVPVSATCAASTERLHVPRRATPPYRGAGRVGRSGCRVHVRLPVGVTRRLASDRTTPLATLWNVDDDPPALLQTGRVGPLPTGMTSSSCGVRCGSCTSGSRRRCRTTVASVSPHLGVPTAGAVDRAAHDLVNRLVGNHPRRSDDRDDGRPDRRGDPAADRRSQHRREPPHPRRRRAPASRRADRCGVGVPRRAWRHRGRSECSDRAATTRSAGIGPPPLATGVDAARRARSRHRARRRPRAPCVATDGAMRLWTRPPARLVHRRHVRALIGRTWTVTQRAQPGRRAARGRGASIRSTRCASTDAEHRARRRARSRSRRRVSRS